MLQICLVVLSTPQLLTPIATPGRSTDFSRTTSFRLAFVSSNAAALEPMRTVM
jgi:hypothetical protein